MVRWEELTGGSSWESPSWWARSTVPGVIGLKAYHLTTAEEAKTVPKLHEFYIDIGARNRARGRCLGDPW